MKHPVTNSMKIGFMFGAAIAAATMQLSAFADMSPEEIRATFDEIGADIGPGNDKDPPPADPTRDPRWVWPKDFGNYSIVIDVFRASLQRPVLGKFYKEYVDSLVAPSVKGASKRLELAKRRYARVGGTTNTAGLEFAVVSVAERAGEPPVPVRAYVVSGALEKKLPTSQKDKYGITKLDPVTGQAITKDALKTTVPGNYIVTPVMKGIKVLGPDGKPVLDALKKPTYEDVPWPFLSSSSYDRSTMYWGLSVDSDGRLIHATPHYFELGRPASMGCVRQSTPDAMWLFDLIVNKANGRKAMIRIHQMHSIEAQNRLREIFYDPHFVPSKDKEKPAKNPSVILPPAPDPVFAGDNATSMAWLVGRIYESDQKIRTYMAKTNIRNYEGYGHGWWNATLKRIEDPVFPMCGHRDCFEAFGDPIQSIQKLKDADDKAFLKQRTADIKAGRPIPRADSVRLGMPVSPDPANPPPTNQ